MSNLIFKREVVLNGEAREIEFKRYSEEHWMAESSEYAGAYQKAGGKVWKERLFWNCEKDVLVKSTVILNRNGYRLIGWDDDFGNKSEHNSAAR